MPAVHQIVVHPGPQQQVSLAAGIREIDLASRGGDLVVSVGEGPQDVEFDGKVLPAGHSVTSLPLLGDDPRIAVMLIGDSGIGMLQVTAH